MKSLKTKLAILSLVGAVAGMLISTFLVALSVSEGDVITSGGWVIAQFVGSGLMGAVCMGSSVVYDIESWGLVRVTVTHYAIAMIAFLITSISLKWFSNSELLIAVGIYTVVYALIWLFEYLMWKKEIRKINRDLQKMIEKEAVKEKEGGSR